MSEVKTLAVIGSGQMGGGIAQVAATAGPSAASRAFHESFGFQPVGVMRRCGSKFGALHDVLIMDLHLDGSM